MDRRTQEVQAESVAYVVSKAIGLDTADYSFGYIAGWSSGKEAKELKASLQVIRDAADSMITGIQNKMMEIMEQKQEREAKRAEVIVMRHGGMKMG